MLKNTILYECHFDPIAIKKMSSKQEKIKAMDFNQTFSILFWLNRLKTNSHGLAPIWVRITVAGKRAQFSGQRQIHPESRHADKNRAKGNSTEARSLNDYLLMIQAKIKNHYNILLSTKEL